MYTSIINMAQSSKFKSTSNIITLYTYDTIFCADSVEWCPHEPNQDLFVCGNYQLDDTDKSKETETKPCKRFGKIKLFSINEVIGLTLLQEIDTPAILDQKWCHCKITNYSYLGVVNAENTLEVYKLDEKNRQLELVCSITNEPKDILMLSLDWSTGKYSNSQPLIVTSDSKGFLNLFKFGEDKLINVMKLSAHDYEAWICGFYYWDTNILFSGGDDSKLLKFDLRIGKEPLLKSSSHFAGVTSLHSNKDREFLLASGSYDANVYLWDIRKMKNPQNSIEMPGTLWRLKWSPHDDHHILAAAMRGGFHILNALPTEDLKIVASYYEHEEDLAYGADWSFLSKDIVQRWEGTENNIIATCSFYDHKLSVAKLKI